MRVSCFIGAMFLPNAGGPSVLDPFFLDIHLYLVPPPAAPPSNLLFACSSHCAAPTQEAPPPAAAHAPF